MDNQLTHREMADVNRFLRSSTSGIGDRPVTWAVSFLLVACGLILGGWATILFLGNPTDHAARYVLLPGGGGGLLTAMTGVLVSWLAERTNERKRLAAILKKLLA